MQKMQKRLLLAATLASLLLIGAGCLGGNGTAAPKPVILEYWRMDDAAATFDPAIAAYKKLHPYVTVHVTTVRSQDFEQKLLEALAIDKGPDLFSIPNVSLAAWASKILPAPAQTTVATQTVDANKNIVTVNRKTPTISLLELRNAFVEGAANDVVLPAPADKPDAPPVDKIFGLPLSFDTLVLYDNKSLFAKSGFTKLPITWQDVQEQADKMTVLDATGNVLTSGAAIGAANVRYATDILAAIMAQNGAQLSDPTSGYATFSQYTDATRDKANPPGLEALLFYQGFENPGALGRSWSEAMPDSLDAFVAGRVGFYFGYPSDAAKIRAAAPGLDFGIAPLPQVDVGNPKDIARYPIEVVSKKTAHPDEAWDFLQFMAQPEQVSGWLSAVKRPTALRSLIASQLTDPAIAPFAGQILTGRSWYRGKDWPAVEKAFQTLILYRPVGGDDQYVNMLSNAAASVNSTF